MSVPMPNGTYGPAPNPPPSTEKIAGIHSVLAAASGLVKLANPKTRRSLSGKGRKSGKSRKSRKCYTRKNRKSKKTRKTRRN